MRPRLYSLGRDNSMDIDRLLSASDFFRNISAAGRRTVASICFPRAYIRRETIFREGESGHSMYVLSRGTVQLWKTSGEGKEVVIKLIRPGEVFAEVVLFERADFPVSARALSEVEVFVVPKRQFQCLLEEQGFRNDFISMLLSKQRYLADRIFQISALDVEDRFFRFLRDHFGAKESYSLDLSKRDVAAAIDALPETLSRLLLKLRDEGTAQWDGETLILNKGFWEKRGPA